MPTSMENECVAATENIIQDGVVNAGTEIEIKAPEKCSWPNVLSVSLSTYFIKIWIQLKIWFRLVDQIILLVCERDKKEFFEFLKI